MDIYQQLFLELIASFAGAFFSYMFLRMTDFFVNVYNRKIRHYNAMVGLEYDLVEQFEIVKDLQYSIRAMRKTFSFSDEPKISFDHLDEVPYAKNLMEELNSTHLINLLHLLQYQFRRINGDVRMVNRSYRILRESFISKQIDLHTFKLNISELDKMLSVLDTYLEEVLDDIIDLLAEERLLIKNARPIGLFLQRLFDSSSDKFPLKKKTLEIAKVKRDLNISSKKVPVNS